MVVGDNKITETDFDVAGIGRFVADLESISISAVRFDSGFKAGRDG